MPKDCPFSPEKCYYLTACSFWEKVIIADCWKVSYHVNPPHHLASKVIISHRSRTKWSVLCLAADRRDFLLSLHSFNHPSVQMFLSIPSVSFSNIAFFWVVTAEKFMWGASWISYKRGAIIFWCENSWLIGGLKSAFMPVPWKCFCILRKKNIRYISCLWVSYVCLWINQSPGEVNICQEQNSFLSDCRDRVQNVAQIYLVHLMGVIRNYLETKHGVMSIGSTS